MPEISIVVTVYNKAAYVEKCLLSCLHQEADPESFEVIAVNDGSTDTSPEILRRLQTQYPRLRLVDQPNAGLSLAREKGAEVAAGRYVWFVDADDTVLAESVRSLLELLSGAPDVVCLRAQTEGEERQRNCIPSDVKNGKDLLLCAACEDCVPFYLFRTSFLKENALHFYPGIYHEDAEFTPRALYAAQHVAVCGKPLYRVFPDPQSMARLPKVKAAYDLLTVAGSLHDFCHSRPMEDALCSVFALRISIALNNALSIISHFDRREQHAFNVFFAEKRMLWEALRQSALKYRLEARLFSVFPEHVVEIYRLMKKIG